MPVSIEFFSNLFSHSWLLAQDLPDQPALTALDKMLQHPEFMFFVFLTIVIVVPSLAGIWFSMRTREWETSLKHAMLERGMSAEEIKMVLDAGSGRGGSRKTSCGTSRREGSRGHSQAADYGSPQTV